MEWKTERLAWNGIGIGGRYAGLDSASKQTNPNGWRWTEGLRVVVVVAKWWKGGKDGKSSTFSAQCHCLIIFMKWCVLLVESIPFVFRSIKTVKPYLVMWVMTMSSLIKSKNVFDTEGMLLWWSPLFCHYIYKPYRFGYFVTWEFKIVVSFRNMVFICSGGSISNGRNELP